MYKDLTIAVDVDNTIFSCNSFLYNIVAKIKFSSSKNSLKFTEIPYNENPKVNPFLKRIFSFLDSKKYIEFPDAIQTLNKLHDEGSKIHMLCCRPARGVFIDSIQEWVNDNGLKYDKLIMGCNNKPYYINENNIDILIDDLLNTCKEVESLGAKSIHFAGNLKNKKAKNKIAPMDFSKVASTWKGVFEQVQELFEEPELPKFMLDLETENY